MNEILIPISNKEFKEKVTIRFNSINDGFNNYNNKTIEGTEEAFVSFLQEAFELNGAENSYVDFYYNVLNDEDKKKLKELINDEDKILLEEFEKNYHEKNIYFKLTKESIPFITRLSTREILFSTIYFTKYPCTIWGNYNKSFPIFYHDNNDIQQYLNIKNELQFFQFETYGKKLNVIYTFGFFSNYRKKLYKIIKLQ